MPSTDTNRVHRQPTRIVHIDSTYRLRTRRLLFVFIACREYVSKGLRGSRCGRLELGMGGATYGGRSSSARGLEKAATAACRRESISKLFRNWVKRTRWSGAYTKGEDAVHDGRVLRRRQRLVRAPQHTLGLRGHGAPALDDDSLLGRHC